jgi:response regulator RpfG family c-di-GMP phosphodiesterase
MKYKILIVDDEPANLRLLDRLFRRDYQIVSAESGSEGLELLKQHDIALIISDQRMPGMSGTEFLMYASQIRPQTVRIILTGYTDVNALVEAINSGIIYKYVTKPWLNEDLKQTVTRALEHYEKIKGEHEIKQHYIRLAEELKATKNGFVQFIAATLYSRDQYSYNHALRTKEHAVAIGHSLDLGAEEIEQLSIAASLCEIGKLSLPDNILQKAGALSDDEQMMVEQSTELEARMLKSIPGMEEIASVIRYQFEHYDGSRAPEYLQNEQIPLYARIISVAGAFDSMINPRAAKRARTLEDALEQLQIEAGKKFDPAIVEMFCELQSNESFDQPGEEEITELPGFSH